MSARPREPVVVIGAGMGGLAATLSLAARGVPVTLVERHDGPGGKARRVEVGGREIDAGPTVFTMRPVFEALFARAGLALDDRVGLHRAELLARHSWVGGGTLDLFADVEASCAAIDALCGGGEADAYRAFAARTREVFETLDAPFMRAQRPNPVALSFAHGLGGLPRFVRTEPFATLWASLSRRFADPRLRQLFARYATYCGSSPFRAPATLMLIAHVERTGVWLVDGGMRALARAIADAATERGATLRFGTGVERIDVTRDRVSGVALEDGTRLPAASVVFNGDTEALARGLLGAGARRTVPTRPEASLSAVTRCELARTSGFPLAHHTVFFGADYPDEFDAVFERGGITDDPTVYVCAQDRAGDVEAALTGAPGGDGTERLLSLVNAPARPDDGELGRAGAMRIDATLARHGLVRSDPRGEAVTTSPAGFDALFPASDGALYGRPTHGWTGSFSRPGALGRTRGLYLAGGGVHPGAGVPMAALSGQLAADRLWRDAGGESGGRVGRRGGRRAGGRFVTL